MQQIRTFFIKKYIFFLKNLRICIFCSTFAGAFEKKHFRQSMSYHAEAWGRMGEWLKPTVC